MKRIIIGIFIAVLGLSTFGQAKSDYEDWINGAGRFLFAAAPKDGKVILDFNKAENPPCAFTAFATCPLPPQQNRLEVEIKAGEKRYRH